jgi:hypothetical protein
LTLRIVSLISMAAFCMVAFFVRHRNCPSCYMKAEKRRMLDAAATYYADDGAR